MTLTSSSAKDLYTGDGAVSVFGYTFKIFADTDIKVTEVLIADGTETLLTLITDYTVSGAGDADGGNITLVAGALPSTKEIVLQRNQTQEQTLDLEENDPQPSDNVETQFDKIVAMIQQNQEETDRSIKQSITDTGVTLTIPSAEALKVIGFNATADALILFDNPESSATDASASAAAAAASEAAAASSEAAAASSASDAADSAAEAEAFTDRGDPSSVDFETGDFTTDNTWKDLDLSSIVPAGVVAVLLHVAVKDDAVGSLLQFRKNGNSNARAISRVKTQVANIDFFVTIIVACDTNRVIEYLGDNLTFSTIEMTVLGWF